MSKMNKIYSLLFAMIELVDLLSTNLIYLLLSSNNTSNVYYCSLISTSVTIITSPILGYITDKTCKHGIRYMVVSNILQSFLIITSMVCFIVLSENIMSKWIYIFVPWILFKVLLFQNNNYVWKMTKTHVELDNYDIGTKKYFINDIGIFGKLAGYMIYFIVMLGFSLLLRFNKISNFYLVLIIMLSICIFICVNTILVTAYDIFKTDENLDSMEGFLVATDNFKFSRDNLITIISFISVFLLMAYNMFSGSFKLNYYDNIDNIENVIYSSTFYAMIYIAMMSMYILASRHIKYYVIFPVIASSIIIAASTIGIYVSSNILVVLCSYLASSNILLIVFYNFITLSAYSENKVYGFTVGLYNMLCNIMILFGELIAFKNISNLVLIMINVTLGLVIIGTQVYSEVKQKVFKI